MRLCRRGAKRAASGTARHIHHSIAIAHTAHFILTAVPNSSKNCVGQSNKKKNYNFSGTQAKRGALSSSSSPLALASRLTLVVVARRKKVTWFSSVQFWQHWRMDRTSSCARKQTVRLFDHLALKINTNNNPKINKGIWNKALAAQRRKFDAFMIGDYRCFCAVFYLNV